MILPEWTGLAIIVLVLLFMSLELWMLLLGAFIMFVGEIMMIGLDIILAVENLIRFIFSSSGRKLSFAILVVGCFITSIGTGITGSSIVFGLGVALITLSSIAIRVQENREFTNPNHDLAVYQSMKIKSGLINLGLGIMCCIVAIAITGVVAIDICTIPGLALVGFGAGKVMKHSFIARSSPELLSWVIRVKYFYRNTIGLIAKATEYKTNQTSQRVAV